MGDKLMARIIQGKLDAKGGRFAIVISRFNSLISDRLLSGAIDALERRGLRRTISVLFGSGKL